MGSVEVSYEVTKAEVAEDTDGKLMSGLRNQARVELKALANAGGDLIIHGTLVEKLDERPDGGRTVKFSMDSR